MNIGRCPKNSTKRSGDRGTVILSIFSSGFIAKKHLWHGLTMLLEVYDGSDNLLMRFEYADGRMPVAMTKNGSIYYLICDQVGSLRVVADAAGNVVKRIDYDSFGNIIDDTDPAFEVPFGFAGAAGKTGDVLNI